MSQKVILISGASAGIGEQVAEDFHGRGYRVVCLARRKERLDSLCARLNALRANSALAVAADVTQPETLKAAVKETLEKFGRLDGFVANAGFGVAGLVSDLTVEDYRRQFETNVFGVLECFYASKNELLKSKGFFAVVGSVNSYLSLPTTSAYAMSKFAVRAFTESLYWEMKPHGVSVTLICPGFIDTEIRRVSNDGVFKEKNKDPVPAWIMMPAKKAAQQTVDACMRRKKEVIITGHGKIMTFIARHCPCLLNPFHKSLVKDSGRWNESKT